ncbi:MAG TPA: ABC transporter permease subunit [Pseudonocardia sp.]|nr:ABC transporter permease subunit [Pseudonocardia sp.]
MGTRTMFAIVLTSVPVVAALLGPLLAGWVHAGEGGPYARQPGHLLGTDALGHDVLTATLRGGRTLLVTSLAATLLAYVVGGSAGLLAAASRWRGVESLVFRPLDVVGAIPTLLLLSVAAVWARAEPAVMALVVALAYAPRAARLVHASALEAAAGLVVEAMRQQRESWIRIYVGYVGRSVLRPALSDMGTRLTGATYLIASATFLGLGLAPTEPDWAVAIATNQAGLMLQPWTVLAPTGMIVSFVVGVNLLTDTLVSTNTGQGQLP